MKKHCLTGEIKYVVRGVDLQDVPGDSFLAKIKNAGFKLKRFIGSVGPGSKKCHMVHFWCKQADDGQHVIVYPRGYARCNSRFKDVSFHRMYDYDENEVTCEDCKQYTTLAIIERVHSPFHND